MPRLAPGLPDKVVEEILLRLPRDELACLVRASSVSKPWHRFLSDPAFRRSYRDFHGMLPMFGFFYLRLIFGDPVADTRFIPTTTACSHQERPRIPKDSQLHKFSVLDCRHGRVILGKLNSHSEEPPNFVVWDPMTGRRLTQLNHPEGVPFRNNIGIAVFCAAAGCDHIACHERSLRVVFVCGNMDKKVVTASVYSSDSTEWSAPTSELVVGYDTRIQPIASVLVGDAVHFLLTRGRGTRILRYDLIGHCLSVVDVPATVTAYDRGTILMVTEESSLGIAHLEKFTVRMWSLREMGDAVPWLLTRVVNLETFLPIGNPTTKVVLIGSMEGTDIIFMMTDLGIYAVDLKCLWWKKLCQKENLLHALFPFTSFYNPPGIFSTTRHE